MTEFLGAGAAGLPLAEAKLSPPRERPDTIARPRIMEALDESAGAALTLVAAPAGYGKTTAVRAWLAKREVPFAWVTLDAADNDAFTLWTYVAAAIDGVRGGLGRGALRRLADRNDSLERSVGDLLVGIEAFEAELVIVLDDLHAVTAGDCLASLELLVERLPANARLICMTRSDPGMRLSRLRVRGALGELRARELAFTPAETRAFLIERNRLLLGADELELLYRRTEGWPAALVLAALWLRSVEDLTAALQEFGGDNRFVVEYLTQEVLASLDDEERSFLLRASVLGRFTAELCDAALGRSDSTALLARLTTSNLLVDRLERGHWFRVHPLFAEFAGVQLATLAPGVTADIHRRAAGWLRARRLPLEAAEQAAAAGDDRLVAEILAEAHLVLIRAAHAGPLLRRVGSLPDERLAEQPALVAAAATAALMLGGRTIEKRRLLSLLHRAESSDPERVSPYVRAVARMVRAASVDRDVGQAVADGRNAVALASGDADEVRVAALAGYARALYLAGRQDEAWSAALEAVEHPEAERRPPGHAFARTTLALVAAQRGRLELARAHAERARTIVKGIGSSRSWLGANAAVAVGVTLAGEGDLVAAERELVGAGAFFHDEVATVHDAWLSVLVAGVRTRRGRLEEAEAALRLAREAMDDLRNAGRVPALANAVQEELETARYRARSGELVEVPSDAQLAVLRLLVTDLSVREIASELYLSPNTVRSHIRSLYRKLGVGCRADAVARAEALELLGRARSPG